MVSRMDSLVSTRLRVSLSRWGPACLIIFAVNFLGCKFAVNSYLKTFIGCKLFFVVSVSLSRWDLPASLLYNLYTCKRSLL